MACGGLAQLIPEVDLLLTSPIPRAWQTAGLLHREAGWIEPVETDLLRLDTPAGDVIEAVGRLKGFRTVALVGHEPQLSVLLGRFLGATDGISGLHFSEGAVCCLRFDHLPQEGAGTLLWMATPSMLQRIRRGRGLLEMSQREEARAAG